MSRKSTNILKAALKTMHYSGLDRMMAPMARGVGMIFMLHQVTPGEPAEFEPNRILQVTPEFLDAVITQVKESGFDIVSLDEAYCRMREGEYDRPFACFTFDDGYKDNAEFAYPIFRKHNAPFAIYVPTDFPDGRGDLWWLVLEKVLAERERLNVKVDGRARDYDLSDAAGKQAAFHEIYWWLRQIKEDDARNFVAELARDNGFDAQTFCNSLVMNWDELRELASDPLVTIGAHTRGHYALAKLPAAEAHAQMDDSITRLEYELDRPCRHFSYPYGTEDAAGEREFDFARELGMKTAVTTRKGPLFSEHEKALTALPRISLNGDYQDLRYFKVFLSGAPFLLWRMLKKITPARKAA